VSDNRPDLVCRQLREFSAVVPVEAIVAELESPAVGHEDVEIAIIVIIEPGTTAARPRRFVQIADIRTKQLSEGAVAVVAIEHVIPCTNRRGEERVEIAVAVVICPGRSNGSQSVGNDVASLAGGHLVKVPIPIVPKERVR